MLAQLTPFLMTAVFFVGLHGAGQHLSKLLLQLPYLLAHKID